MNSKVKCLILDDELPGLMYLRMLCEQLPFADVVRCFDSPEQFIAQHANLDYDVCLLDIHMPGVSGIEIARLLKHKPVIFISAHPEFAIDAFDLEAVDFIKKPVTRERLEKALLKIKPKPEETTVSPYFTWNTQLGRSTIYTNDILLITTGDVDKRDKIAFLSNDTSLVLKNITMDKLLEFLPAVDFFRVNKSDIICRRSIQAYTAEVIVLNMRPHQKAPSSVPLGDAYRKAFLQWIQP